MTIWRYSAIHRDAKHGAKAPCQGELAAESAADARAALRRIGLMPLELIAAPEPRSVGRESARRAGVRSEEARGEARGEDRGRVRGGDCGGAYGGARGEGRSGFVALLLASFRRSWFAHVRKRRRAERAEICDGLATMLESGLPLLEAFDTLIGDNPIRRGFVASMGLSVGGASRRTMLLSLREQLRSGQSLDQTLASHPAWFDSAEVAMVRAAALGGTLPTVLRAMAQQHERTDQLGQKLAAALTYPAIVALVGLGVVAFLSTKTLPDLAGILTSSGVEVPRLTQWVIACGRLLVDYWLALLFVIGCAAVAGVMLPGLVSAYLRHTRVARNRCVRPQVLRRMAVASMSMRLAELIRSGVPMVEAMRVIAPTTPGASLRRILEQAADRLESGEELSSVLDSPAWFDAEYRRLVEIGQASGELDRLLDRIGERYQRRAERLIARLATLLEPAVILLLAAMIGLVAMAAVLPLVRLRDVL